MKSFGRFKYKNIEEKKLKTLLLMEKPNGINALVCSAKCKSQKTTKFVINIAKILISFEDFAEAFKTEDRNWVVDALCECTA